ncbi:hypothetical protein [Variovorax sp. 278MFTsu5.1]|uniref:hypothetical protein n=1 Tax=Variovorax sp. 278MFTsu5.1 TaxID=3158366 RepID=UPI003AAFCE26
MVTLSAPKFDTKARARRVEILGVFGSGKTTLAKRLTAASGRLLPEDHERNPFWGDSNSIAVLGYLGYDLSFLLQHAHLVSTVPSDTIAFCDWSFETDWLWASLRLADDLPAYEAIRARILKRLGPPTGYLFLRQTPDTIVDRIERRSRPAEDSFRQYVRSACAHLDELTNKLPREKLLVVDDHVEPTAVYQWLDGMDARETS